MNLALMLTAVRMGAKCANHVAVTDLIRGQDEQGKTVLRGAKVRDEVTGMFQNFLLNLQAFLFSGKEFTVRAKCVVNATGAFSDHIRQMDNPDVMKIVVPSQGVHVVLPVSIFLEFPFLILNGFSFRVITVPSTPVYWIRQRAMAA